MIKEQKQRQAEIQTFLDEQKQAVPWSGTCLTTCWSHHTQIGAVINTMNREKCERYTALYLHLSTHNPKRARKLYASKTQTYSTLNRRVFMETVL